MKRPQFKAGDRVTYDRHDGIVECCINAKDVEDVRAQGYRYEAAFYRWPESRSVPEHCLVPAVKTQAREKYYSALGGASTPRNS